MLFKSKGETIEVGDQERNAANRRLWVLEHALIYRQWIAPELQNMSNGVSQTVQANEASAAPSVERTTEYYQPTDLAQITQQTSNQASQNVDAQTTYFTPKTGQAINTTTEVSTEALDITKSNDPELILKYIMTTIHGEKSQ